MLLSLARLSHYGFNQRALTLSDFYTICESEKIKVLEEDIDCSFFMTFRGRKWITLSRKMTPLKTLFVAYHELHHAMLSPEMMTRVCFFGLDDTPEERSANMFAAVALIPRHEIADARIIENDCEFAKVIYEQRVRVFQTYDI